MPRPVVPIFLAPLFASRAMSILLWYGMMMCSASERSSAESSFGPVRLKPGDLHDEDLRVEHHAVADDAARPFVQYAGGDQVQNHLLVPDHQRVPGVVATLVAHHGVGKLREMSTTFPFPSSPHWAPITTTFAMI